MQEIKVLNIDMIAVREIALTGVRRASAFVGLGLKAIQGGPPKSVALDTRCSILWIKEPLSEEAGLNIASEYETWLVGAGLKELDQHFAIFLDQIWELERATKFHNQILEHDLSTDKKFESETNVAKKLLQVGKALDLENLHSDYFQGYSNARNALSHNAGKVRDRDCTEDGNLVLRWIAPEFVIPIDDGLHVIDQRSGLPSPQIKAETILSFRMREREARFAVGDLLRLSPYDISEICFSYQQMADQICRGLEALFIARGIPVPSVPSSPS